MSQSTTTDQTVWATREALGFLAWARRFAESQLEEPEGGD